MYHQPSFTCRERSCISTKTSIDSGNCPQWMNPNCRYSRFPEDGSMITGSSKCSLSVTVMCSTLTGFTNQQTMGMSHETGWYGNNRCNMAITLFLSLKKLLSSIPEAKTIASTLRARDRRNDHNQLLSVSIQEGVDGLVHVRTTNEQLQDVVGLLLHLHIHGQDEWKDGDKRRQTVHVQVNWGGRKSQKLIEKLRSTITHNHYFQSSNLNVDILRVQECVKPS